MLRLAAELSEATPSVVLKAVTSQRKQLRLPGKPSGGLPRSILVWVTNSKTDKEDAFDLGKTEGIKAIRAGGTPVPGEGRERTGETHSNRWT